jgi:hypothetical protein
MHERVGRGQRHVPALERQRGGGAVELDVEAIGIAGGDRVGVGQRDVMPPARRQRAAHAADVAGIVGQRPRGVGHGVGVDAGQPREELVDDRIDRERVDDGLGVLAGGLLRPLGRRQHPRRQQVQRAVVRAQRASA